MKQPVRRYQVLARLINEHNWTQGAEIGVYKGATFFYLLDHCPELNLIGVDSWASSDEPHEKDMNLGLSTWRPPHVMKEIAESVKAKADLYDRAMIYEMDSVEAASQVPDGSLDFAFIDADHATDGVLRDVRAWAPKVRTGGTILGHDANWPSVQRALKQLFPQGWKRHFDNVWSVPQSTK